jgi:hypothetical protein
LSLGFPDEYPLLWLPVLPVDEPGLPTSDTTATTTEEELDFRYDEENSFELTTAEEADDGAPKDAAVLDRAELGDAATEGVGPPWPSDQLGRW